MICIKSIVPVQIGSFVEAIIATGIIIIYVIVGVWVLRSLRRAQDLLISVTSKVRQASIVYRCSNVLAN